MTTQQPSEQIEDFARNLVDDLRAAETIRDRDEADTGERLSVEQLAEECGCDLGELPDA